MISSAFFSILFLSFFIPEKTIQKVFSVLCHQMKERTPEDSPVCFRCLGIYLGFFASMISIFLVDLRIHFIYSVLFIFPIAFDGITQMLKLRKSANSLRFTTGFIFGLGTAVILNSIVKNSYLEQQNLFQFFAFLSLFSIILFYLSKKSKKILYSVSFSSFSFVFFMAVYLTIFLF